MQRMTEKESSFLASVMEKNHGRPGVTNHSVNSFLDEFGLRMSSQSVYSASSVFNKVSMNSSSDKSNSYCVSDEEISEELGRSVDCLNSRSYSPKFLPLSATTHLCRVCDKTFRASSLLDIHMRVHVGAKPFACPMCGHRATQKGNLKLHMKKHHGADLPPHIDLVPDSGIWGHPRENLLCIGTTQTNNEIENSDLSGKRKHVAQAVSSLLDEEIVELIKKCQNNVGQGMTGRITESLEDFIHIAKNKANLEDNAFDKADYTLPCDENCEDFDFSDKYQQEPKKQIRPPSIANEFLRSDNIRMLQSSQPQRTATESASCLMCGRRLDMKAFPSAQLTGNSILQLCTICLKREGTHCIAEENCVKKKESICDQATINGVHCVETEKGPNTTCMVCDICGAVFFKRENYNNHEKCHLRHQHADLTSDDVIEISSSVKLPKEEYLEYLGLKQKSNSEHIININQGSLNPLIGHMTVCLLQNKPPNSGVTSSSIKQEWLRGSSHMKKKYPKAAMPNSPAISLDTNTRVGNRASPSILNMLRQTVLNSVEQKIASGNLNTTKGNYQDRTIAVPPERQSSYATADTKQKPKKHLLHYRNAAMQSLAQIGQSLLPTENSSGYQEQSLTAERSSSPAHRVPTDVSPATLAGNLHSIILNLKDQENAGFSCQYCPKWFKYRSVLEIHMRSHTGERPYKCPYCDYAGTQHNCLKLHIQRHHRREYALSHTDFHGNKGPSLSVSPTPPAPFVSDSDISSHRVSCFSPVKCPICGRVSPSPGYLKIHMRSHKKSLDHVCHVCGRGFKEYWYLSTHLKTHERELSSMKFNMKALQRQALPPASLIKSLGGKDGPTSSELKRETKIDASMSASVFPSLHKEMKENSSLPSIPCSGFFSNCLSKVVLLSGSNPSSCKSSKKNKNDVKCEPNELKPIDATLKRKLPLENTQSKRGSPSDREMLLLSAPSVTSNRRKTSCPLKISSKPVSVEESLQQIDGRNTTPTESIRRKSRPKKVFQGAYLMPPLSKLSFGGKHEDGLVIKQHFDETEWHNQANDDLPLDLSRTSEIHKSDDKELNSTENTGDEPLNLSKTNVF